MSILDEPARYQGTAKPNPVVLHVPPHVAHRVPGIGQIVPIQNPSGLPEDITPYGENITEWRWWSGPREMAIGASIDTSEHGALLHVSASYPKALPSWAAMTALRTFFFPDTVDVAMIIPRRADYVNLHSYCFHLWAIPVNWGIR